MNGFNCIAIETATSHCSLAVCADERVAVEELPDARASSRQLYSAVRALLAESKLTAQQLDCVAFGCGPGSFTGVRVAAGAAQALAYSLSLPVCQVSTLAAMAMKVAVTGYTGTVAAALDARMGEVYAGVYSISNSGQLKTLLPDQLVAPADFKLQYEGDVVAVGNGWELGPEMLANNRAAIAGRPLKLWPDASSVLQIARSKFAAGDLVTPAEALPNYLRNQVTQDRPR